MVRHSKTCGLRATCNPGRKLRSGPATGASISLLELNEWDSLPQAWHERRLLAIPTQSLSPKCSARLRGSAYHAHPKALGRVRLHCQRRCLRTRPSLLCCNYRHKKSFHQDCAFRVARKRLQASGAASGAAPGSAAGRRGCQSPK